MSKLFTVAGASVQNGEFKLRFANSIDRAQVLTRAGHTWVKLFVLPRAMDKEAAEQYIAQEYPNLRDEASSGLMDRIVRDIAVKRVPRRGTDEQRVNAQFAVWRERAVKKFDWLTD